MLRPKTNKIYSVHKNEKHKTFFFVKSSSKKFLIINILNNRLIFSALADDLDFWSLNQTLIFLGNLFFFFLHSKIWLYFNTSLFLSYTHTHKYLWKSLSCSLTAEIFIKIRSATTFIFILSDALIVQRRRFCLCTGRNSKIFDLKENKTRKRSWKQIIFDIFVLKSYNKNSCKFSL